MDIPPPRARRIAAPAFVAAFGLLVTGACGPAPGREAAKAPDALAPDFDSWSEGFIKAWVQDAPQVATRTQYLPGPEQEASDRQLGLVGEFGNPFGARTWDARAALARRGLEELRAIPAASMSPVQRTSAAMLEWVLDDTVRTSAFGGHVYVFEQFGGLQLDLVNHLTSTHPIRNRRDVEHYLARLEQVAGVLDRGIAEAQAAAARGIVPPRVILQRTIEQIDGFLSGRARDNVLVSSLDRRMQALGDAVPASDRATFVTAAERSLDASVLPAFRRVRDHLASALPTASDEVGVWRLPKGDAFYAQALRTYTTTTLTADEIHAIGLREVARIEGEMDALLRQLGYADGSVNERYAKLEAALQPRDRDPRAAILADNERWLRDAERRAVETFDLRPRAPVEVRREPAFSEKTAAAHYTDPAPDGSRPGIFWLPLPGPPFGILRRRTLVHHEAVPGHHFQIALQQEMSDLPAFRRRTVVTAGSAFIEGWGLYAERVADESGWFDGDPQGRLGYLQSMLFRARRLVVDTGIHAKRWTRQQAIDYGIGAQEVERYIAWPGQACSYMIGQLHIVDLREKARAALGSKFSIKAFHNLVLRTGDVPLEVLAQEVDAWIAQSR
ncbi:MAG: DUF885 family protein [Vicinamibacterales bacterium]